MLICSRQIGAAKIDLRRFIELIAWDIYFRDHKIEWERFQKSPISGFARDLEDPIEYCAHRELAFYLNYARALVAEEPSQTSLQAVHDLKKVQGELNGFVHAGAVLQSTQSVLPFDGIQETDLKQFNDIQKEVFKNSCLLLAAVRSRDFDQLPPMHRAYFDWLVGPQLERKIRSGPFGIGRI